ncbi:MAG: hypothetical protein IE931_02990 [Sphingobacteriales bacterium]|nr:hypothetical protein [Sphingobacteriales bacterium]
MKNIRFKPQTLCLLLLAFSFLLFSGMKCKKDSTSFNTKDQLPAITKEGKNTFGFLLNGEVWLPKGGLLDQKLDLSYDPNYSNGSFGLFANRYISSTDKMELTIGATDINKKGTYQFSTTNRNVIYRDTKSNCYYYDNTQITGFITITKIDLTGNGIISGTFEFTLVKDGCPTIVATEGRFDMSIQ